MTAVPIINSFQGNPHSDVIRYSPLEDEASEAHRERRGDQRMTAPGARPLWLRLTKEHSNAASGSPIYADIIDICKGGLCLMLDSTAGLRPGAEIEVDFSLHQPCDGSVFQRPWKAVLCWIAECESIITLGLSFTSPLPELPVLLTERRGCNRH